MGGSEGSLGGAVTVAGGSYTGERGLARRGLGAADGDELWMLLLLLLEGDCGSGWVPLVAPVEVMLSLREKLGW